MRLDTKFPFHGAHGRLTYDIHDKNWKIQLEKVQLTRDLKDDTIIYKGIRLPCKNDHGYYYSTTRTQATIVWFPEDSCTTFQVAKIHARMIKFKQKKIY